MQSTLGVLFQGREGLVLFFLAIYAAGSILNGLGGFLILEGFARVRPDSRPWTSVGGVLVLIASIALVGGIIGYSVAIGNPGLPAIWLLLLSIIQVTLGFIAGGAFLLGLFGVGRALTSRPRIEAPGVGWQGK